MNLLTESREAWRLELWCNRLVEQLKAIGDGHEVPSERPQPGSGP